MSLRMDNEFFSPGHGDRGVFGPGDGDTSANESSAATRANGGPGRYMGSPWGALNNRQLRRRDLRYDRMAAAGNGGMQPGHSPFTAAPGPMPIAQTEGGGGMGGGGMDGGPMMSPAPLGGGSIPVMGNAKRYGKISSIDNRWTMPDNPWGMFSDY